MSCLYAMPILLANLGGEMIYILDQRLKAQKIKAENAEKVITDVLSTIFEAKIQEDLFKPQRIYSNSSTRRLFDKAAHSSIMRLSTSSMDKLYDLMTMGLKHQLLASSSPKAPLEITRTHLKTLLSMLRTSSSFTVSLLTQALHKFEAFYSNWTVGEFMRLRSTLLDFLQLRRVKVSLFLQEGIQLTDASIVIPMNSTVLLPSHVPGEIRYFNDQFGVERKSSWNYTGQAKQGSHTLPESERLGINLYNRPRNKDAKHKERTKVPSLAASSSMTDLSYDNLKTAVKEEAKVTSAIAATNELDFLSNLISKNSSTETFKLSLFDDDEDEDESVMKSEGVVIDSSKDADEVAIIRFTSSTTTTTTTSAIANEFDALSIVDNNNNNKGKEAKKEEEEQEKGNNDGDGEDLLDLMDDLGE